MTAPSKLMVIGIDGVPHELIGDLTEQGVMPHTKRLIRQYPLLKTRAPLPEVSSVSWTSFMTGMNPGEHGIYGFMELNPRNYSYTFPSFKTLPVKTLWEIIGERGGHSVIINLPSTYPVRPMKGKMVSGFVALDLEKAVFPPDLYSELEEMEYEVDVDTAIGRSDKHLFLKELENILDMRVELYERWGTGEPWDLFFFILTGTDRLHHFMFDALDDPGSPYRQGCLDYYRKVDEVIGRVTGDMERRGIPFIILSDHGFVRLKQEVYISQYLKRWGYLELEDHENHKNLPPKNLKSMTSNTKVFALDPSRLYIHREGKYARGCVSEDRCRALMEEVRERFMDLEIDGEKVIRRVFFKEEIYHGPYLDQAPDMVLLGHYGYDMKSGVTKSGLSGTSHFTGMHSQDNAVLIDALGLDLEERPFISDIGRKLREYLI